MIDLAEKLRKLLLAPAMAFAIPDDSVREHIQEKVRALADEVEAVEAFYRALCAECPACGTTGALTCVCGDAGSFWEWTQVLDALPDATGDDDGD